MNAWNIYLVMQLDSICNMLMVIIVASTGSGVLCALLSGLDGVKKLKRPARALLTLGCVSLLAAGFLPSTKTAAAMVILPQLANNEILKTESKELYSLAKEALRERALGKCAEQTK